MLVPVTARPVSSDTIAGSVIMLDVVAPVTVSVRAAGRAARAAPHDARHTVGRHQRRAGLGTGRRPVDEGVVAGARVQLVALVVLAQRRVRAGRLVVHVVAEQVLGRRVGLDRLGCVGLVLLGGRVVVGVVEAVPGVGERRERLVEGDVDQAALLERLRLLDQRDVVLQEQVRGVQPAGEVLRRGRLRVVRNRRVVVRRAARGERARQVVALADRVVGVAAVVRRDPAERRRASWRSAGRGPGRSAGCPGWRCGWRRSSCRRWTAGSAPGRSTEDAGQRLEPREREVLGHVLVVRLRRGERGHARRESRPTSGSGWCPGCWPSVPGPAHAAASRSGTVLAWNEVSPGVCAPPMSWA